MRDWLAVDVMSCMLGEQARLYSNLQAGSGSENAQKFIAWGSPDLLKISRVSDAITAKGIYHQHADPRIYDRQVHFGHILDGGTNEHLQKLTERLPLVGVSFLKLKDYPIRRIPEKKLGFYAYDWLANYINEKVKSEVLAAFSPDFRAEDLQYIICAATGWADVMLVSFCNSYAPIQLLLSLLRKTTVNEALDRCNINYRKLKNVPNHVLVTTCTIPGTYIGPSAPKGPEEVLAITNILCGKLAKWDCGKVRPMVTAHAKPGHLNAAMEIFQGDEADVFPTLGRSDFMVESRVKCIGTTSEHHKFFLNTLIPTAPDSFMWTETHYGFIGKTFRVEDCPELERSSNPHKINTQLRPIPTEDNDPLFKIVPHHTARAFRQIGSSMLGLAQHEATIDYYKSLATVYQTANINATELADVLVAGPDPKYADWLAENLGTICENIDLCFKDRYRGAFPAGSTSAAPSLASQASFHKCLAVVDGLANATLNVVYNKLQSQHRHAPTASKCQRLSACCHLGNAPMPSITLAPLLGVGFMNIPTDLMFAPGGIVYVLHEVGHVFWGRQRVTDKIFSGIMRTAPPHIERVIFEILSDLFALSIVFRGDSELMFNEYGETLKALTQNSDNFDVKLITMMRCGAAMEIYDSISEPADMITKLDILIKKPTIKPKRSDKAVAALWGKTGKQVLVKIRDIVKCSERFVAALQAVRSLADLKSVDGIGRAQYSLLNAVQDRFADKTPVYTPEEFTHVLWQLLRRSEASGKY